MIVKTFSDVHEANKYRESQREKGLTASRFDYGNGRFLVKVLDADSKNTYWLSNEAWRVSNDIERLNKIKELLSKDDFSYNLEDVTFIAKYLSENNYFPNAKSVISFFEGIDDKEINKIKGDVDSYLKEYDDEWDDYKKDEVNQVGGNV